MHSLTVNLEANVPVYRQIMDQIRTLVAQGKLVDGDELPSVRALGTTLAVNQNTVARAYRELAEEGLLELKQGSRVRVRAANQERAPPDEALVQQQLREILAKWVLGGGSRARYETIVRQLLKEFYS